MTRTRPSRPTPARFALPLLAGSLLATLVGCKSAAPAARAADLAAWRLILPVRIEIQKYITRPTTPPGKAAPDGLEVIVAAYDVAGDVTKVAGLFQFELHRMRVSESDRLGEQVAFWPVPIDSETAVREYWDRLARFYRFPLKLPAGPLRPGRYVLTARVRTLTGETLFDQYEFEPQPADRATGAP